MNFARWAGILALLGGVVLAVAAVLAFADSSSSVHNIVLYLGYGVVVVALMCVGYTTVPHSPVWLRVIVLVAAPLLVAMVWSIVVAGLDSALPASSEDGVVAAVAAVLSLALGGVELRIAAKRHDDDYWAGRRH